MNKHEVAKIASKVGRAGEYAIAAQLLLRDSFVAWPAVDEGYDLLGPSGCRVQVKSAHLSLTLSLRGRFQPK